MDPVTWSVWLLFFTLSQPAPPAAGTALPSTAPPQAAAAKPPDALAGRAELSFVSTTGNTATQTVGTAADVSYKPGRWSLETGGRYVRTTADEELLAESLASQFRVSRTLFDEVAGYGEARYVRNTFAGIRRQTTVEIGVTKDFLKRKTQQVSAEAAFGHIDEDRLSGADRRLSSGSAGLRLQFALTKTSSWTQDARVTTDLGNTDDWRLRHEAAIAASLNAVLSLKFSHAITFVNEPVPGFGRTDALGAAALVARF